MQLQRVLALAGVVLMGCAFSTSAAWDFPDAEPTVSDEDRIYGGTEADASKYPYVASLRKTAEGFTYCGGTLVAPQYIVTAAHCVKNTTYASLGSRYSSGSMEGEHLLVTEVWVHPKYVKDTHVYDVAVMKLEKPSSFATLPLCKADGSQNQGGTSAVVRGWGFTEQRKPSTTLLEVELKIISNDRCNLSYNDRITAQMICAGEGGNRDSCQGDSGGPLIANDVLVGIVSWGGVCGAAPGVYVRVTSVLDFINEKTGAWPSTTSPSSTAPPLTVAPAFSPAPPAPPAPTAWTPSFSTAAPAPTAWTPSFSTAAPAAHPTLGPVPTWTPSSSPIRRTKDPAPAPSPAPVPRPVPAPTPAPVPTLDPTTPLSRSSDAASDAATAIKKPKKDCGARL